MAAADVSSRWQSPMGEFFVDLDGTPDAGFGQLTEVFNDDPLAALDIEPTPDATPTDGALTEGSSS